MSVAHDSDGPRTSTDPLDEVLRPPSNETPRERDERLKAEAHAKKVSDAIDEQIKLERAALKRRREVKILLLGQSESGKSTTLKQFQILHTPAQFRAECSSWRRVIYLNLVRSVNRILRTLEAEVEEHPDDPGLKDPDFEKLRLRLSPVRGIEEELVKLFASAEETETERLSTLASMGQNPIDPKAKGTKDGKEMAIRSTNNWKRIFAGSSHRRESDTSDKHPWEDPKDPGHLIHACSEDMIKLWRHPTVQDTLRKRKLILEDTSGFFLDQLERVTALKYTPSDDDVLKARLKTVGVVEHCFTLEKGTERGVDWKIFDVGGARSQRVYWAPYFTNVDAIIFLAPISVFDQVLQEDTNVNRMEDSLLLWRTVISNKLLENVNIVLFLNKCDLLRLKLKNGATLREHMISYGDRPNDYDTICRYFKTKFTALHQSFSSNPKREIYVHLTSVTDTRTTSSVIVNVRDIILRKNLEGSHLI